MKENSFRISEKVTGQERKVIAAVIAQVLDIPAKYAGVPSFAYEAGGWVIDKDNMLISPELEPDELQNLKTVMAALKIAGISPEGNARVTIAANDCSEGTITNLQNIVKGKATLINKTLGVEGELSVTKNGDLLGFDFYKATLKEDELSAFITFSLKLLEQAKVLKRVTAKEKEVENEKYAFRCFLLRLGFIGDRYKMQIKTLLSRLDGNSAFRTSAGGTVHEKG